MTSPGSATGWTTANAFPNLTFVDPLMLTEIPGTTNFLLVGKDGRLWRFANNPAVTQAQVVLALDWASKTQTSEDQGFYSLVFHPQFGQSGSPNANYAYVCYNHKPALTGADSNHSYWRVSRFTWLPASGTLDPNSEFVLINQFDPDLWHNGGAMFFDNDGFLNITCGDGGDSIGLSQALANTQKIDGGFFSGVFRIDVNNDPAKSHAIRRQPTNHAYKPAAWPNSSTQGYGIPNDNPWLDTQGSVLEEYNAIGLRSPHTAHYDTVTGDVWIGDVGEGAREEITVLPKGGNAQWGFKEGTITGPGTKPTTVIGTEVAPFYDYGRTIGSCVIGGMRYRGTKWNTYLGGKVLFGDHIRGKVWTATIGAGGAAPVIEEIITGFHTGAKAGLANFCTDSTGEVYLMDINGTNQTGGVIRKLVLQGASVEPPALLSQTGAFSNLSTLATAPGFVPFDVNTPLWSDGAHKLRWIMVPNNGSHDTAAEKITFSEKGNWVFPAGTVLMKHFEMPLDERNPSVTRRLETRFIVCTANGGKYGLTYRWNAAGTDAQLLTSGESLDYDITLNDGSTVQRRWDFPSRSDCVFCHNTTSGQALGFRTHQLNKNYTYPATGRTANQLTTFNALGMFDRTLTADEVKNFLQSRAIDDETAPMEHRVRSYMDANCSHCHQPGGLVDYFDARLNTPFNSQGLMDVAVQGHFTDLGVDGRYLKPGDPSLSAVHLRMSHSGDGVAMPPLAKNVVDEDAVALLENYLAGTTPSEFQTQVLLQARYLRLTSTAEVNGNPWTSVGELSILDDKGVAIPTNQLSVAAVDSEETVDETAPAIRAIDGDVNTFWHTGYGTGGIAALPHYITINLGSTRPVGGFVYVPRQGNQNGRIKNYQVHTSTDGVNWTLMTSGTWPNTTDTFRYDQLANSRAARCNIAGPTGVVNGAFETTITFDMDVTDFTAADVQVTGGSLLGLRGKGHYYVATISPSTSLVTVQVPQNAVNPKSLGSTASATLQVDFHDTLPPIPRFTNVPVSVAGTFQLGLTFDEPVTGLTASDFNITNGTLMGIAADGMDYLLTITPGSPGTVGVEIRSGAVVDTAANLMGAGTSISLPYSSYILAREAEQGTLAGAFVQVADAATSGGYYIWVPQGTRGGSTALDTNMKATYTFVVPRAGQYRVRGLARSDDQSSDSFYVGFDGATPSDWHTNQTAGQIGSLQYYWDLANSSRDPVNNPSLFTLTAGSHTMQLYGRDDGTRMDRLELQPVKPFPMWSGPAVAVNGSFNLSLSFTESVTGLTVSDITITGGQVQSITGSGANYVVSVSATSSPVTLSLPANMVTSASANGNDASDPISVIYRTAFEQWAFSHDTDGSPGSRLADDDGDGVPKLLEFSFNLDPTLSDRRSLDLTSSPTAGLPRMIVNPESGGQRLWLQYLRRKNVAGLTYTPQFGSSLNDFSDATGSSIVESLDADWDRVRVPDMAPASSGRRFGRVKVTLSP
ncbi:discoidin domain-containing protein [Luteolibacter ambystomatis]|uniref:Discoidin domain-containing protein n=1 Tax=Luteolibacter ambystomatis TaxID=2824561 RepID=A0A975GA72_9BACT|nr:Ig-like domain-containing protein [Luteolibacter ambystomatis]QUE51400.1 discoidin domain-containing protein [Luteolibacter ambystomatis]